MSIEEDHVRDHHKSGLFSQQCESPTQHSVGGYAEYQPILGPDLEEASHYWLLMSA